MGSDHKQPETLRNTKSFFSTAIASEATESQSEHASRSELEFSYPVDRNTRVSPHNTTEGGESNTRTLPTLIWDENVMSEGKLVDIETPNSLPKKKEVMKNLFLFTEEVVTQQDLPEDEINPRKDKVNSHSDLNASMVENSQTIAFSEKEDLSDPDQGEPSRNIQEKIRVLIECFGPNVQDLSSIFAFDESTLNSSRLYLENIKILSDVFGVKGLPVVLDIIEKEHQLDGTSWEEPEKVIEEVRQNQIHDEFTEIFGPELVYDPKIALQYGLRPLVLRREHQNGKKETFQASKTKSTYIAQLPVLDPHRNILHFTPNLFSPENERQWASNSRNVYTPQNIIRCTPTDSKLVSNARFVSWEDGSYTLHVGNEVFFLHTTSEMEDPHLLMVPLQFELATKGISKGDNDHEESSLLSGAMNSTTAQNPILFKYFSPRTSQQTSIDACLEHEQRKVIPSFTHDVEDSELEHSASSHEELNPLLLSSQKPPIPFKK